MTKTKRNIDIALALGLGLGLYNPPCPFLSSPSPHLRHNPEDGKRSWQLKKCETIEEDENEERGEYKDNEAVEGKHDDKKEEEYNDKVNENDDDDWMEENVGKENNITLNNP